MCREFPEGMVPPKYESAEDWASHIIKTACKGSPGSFVNTLHTDPTAIHFPQRNHASPSRVRHNHADKITLLHLGYAIVVTTEDSL